MLRSILSLWQKTNLSRFGIGAAATRRKSRSWSVAGALEQRTLLASLVSATKLSYQDTDGDNVTVTLSKPVLTAGNVNSIFTFDTGTVNGSNATKQQLRSINLGGVLGVAGTTITTAAVRSATTGGDGFAAVGQINATGIDIGAVTIDGDLGRILAGDATLTTQGLGALKVHSMGRYGTLTGATNLNSVIQGKLASLTTKSDVKDAYISVQGAAASGQIGAISIGGSLIGGTVTNSGGIQSTGDIGAVTITGDVVGGAGQSTGGIVSSGKLASVTIGGSLIGGTGNFSGLIGSSNDMGAVKVTGDVVGGAGQSTGGIVSSAKLTSVTIGGSLIGGSGVESGRIYSSLDMGPVKVTGNVVGGAGQNTGSIFTQGKLASVTIGGDLKGGTGDGGGQINSDYDMGALKVTGNVAGGAGSYTGSIYISGKLASVTIGGSLIGGTGSFSGRIGSSLDMGAVNVTGDVVGGAGDNTGRFISSAKLASVTIGGSLIGGSGLYSGQIFSLQDMGTVKVTGNVVGGSSIETGGIRTDAKLASVSIGGSLIGGSGPQGGRILSLHDMGVVNVTGSIVGGSGSETGSIHSSGKLASVTIGGSLIGGGGSFTARIYSFLDMGAVSVAGDIRGGTGGSSGLIAINAGKITSVTLGGSLIGGSNSFSGGIHSSVGELLTLSIGGDIRGGSASGANELQHSGFVWVNRIGTLTLNGSLIAGTDNTTGTFINCGAIRVTHDIGNLTIKGSVIGNSTNNALITARGQITPVGTTDLAIGKLTINGRVEYGLIVAGSSAEPAVTSSNADAQIGPVVIGGDWIASSLAAGASAGVDAYFGNSNDAKMSGVGVKDFPTVSSKITSIVIGGQVLGTVGGIDHFGFVAENIGSFKVKGGTTTYTLIAGNSNDDILLSLNSLFSGDTRLNEI